MASTVISGIDPTAVQKLMQDMQNQNKNMNNTLNQVNGEVANDIRRFYQGQAASSLLAKIQRQIPALQETMRQVIKEFVRNINEDLEDTKATDQKLV